jgi:hypothetical protein
MDPDFSYIYKKSKSFFVVEENMATLTQVHKPRFVRVVLTNKLDDLIIFLMPRRCMLVSAIIMVSGLCIPILMTLGILAVELLFIFISIALLATGSLLLLYHLCDL